MRDIETRADIELLMRRFYEKLLTDETVRYIFTDVAKIDLEAHIPVLVDFWATILLNEHSYQKNAMQLHLDLHTKSALRKAHFERWLLHFNTSLGELFEGEKAELARQRALSIATVMQVKISQME
jgi:hemoglobin